MRLSEILTYLQEFYYNKEIFDFHMHLNSYVTVIGDAKLEYKFKIISSMDVLLD